MDAVRIEQLQNIIGHMPGDDAFQITAFNRHYVKEWLNEHGIDSSRTDAMRDATLYKAYAKPNYLRAMLTRGDYAPGAAKSTIASYVQRTIDNDIAPPTPPYDISKPPAAYSPPPAPNGHAGDAGAQLAALIGQLASGKVDEARVIELIRTHAPQPEERVVERIVLVDREGERHALPDGEHRHETFADVLTMVDAAIPVMLVGPAGSGKTTMCHQIANAMGKPFSHTGAITSRYELSGYNDAHGNYQRTAFRDAYEHGHHFLFDEVDGSDPSALLWCNTAIANGVCAFPDGNVTRHADFRLVAAANTYGRGADRVYVGRNQLDGASLDRFAVVDFDYDEKLERAVFGDNDWTVYVEKVRAAIGVLQIRHVVSPRATDYGKRLLERGMSREAVKKAVLWKGLKAEQITKIEGECGK